MTKSFLRTVFVVVGTAALTSWLIMTFAFRGFDRLEQALEKRNIELTAILEKEREGEK